MYFAYTAFIITKCKKMVLCYILRILNIAIDTDGSPSGYITRHNHFSNKSKIRTVRPSIKNERFGVQRMEMLAIYFAIVDNLRAFKKLKRTRQTIMFYSIHMSLTIV